MISLRMDSTDQNNQQPIEESNQSSTNDNQMNLNIDTQQEPSTNLALNLGPILRNNLINLLLNYSSLLNGSVEIDSKKKSLDLNTRLIKKLSVLSFSDNKPATDNQETVVDSNKGNLFFELDPTTRLSIVDLLFKNFGCLFLDSDCSSSNKADLVKENNDMACLLINLVPKHLKIPAETDGELIDFDNRLLNRFDQLTALIERVNQIDGKISHINNGLITVNYQIDIKVKEIDNELKKLIQMEKKFEEIDNLKKEFRHVDLRSNETTFTFNIKDARKFLEFKKDVQSNRFYASSVEWYLNLKSNYVLNGVKYVEFYLHLADINEYREWSISANYDLIVFHPSDKTKDRSHRLDYLFKIKEGYGSNGFIKHDELVGYIKDDIIKVGVKLRTDLKYLSKIA